MRMQIITQKLFAHLYMYINVIQFSGGGNYDLDMTRARNKLDYQ